MCAVNTVKCFWQKTFSGKMTSLKNIFRWKPFYVEVNGVLLENGFPSSFRQTDHNPTLPSFTLKTHAPHSSSLSLSILIIFFTLNKQLSLSVGISSTLIFLYFFVESYGVFHSLEKKKNQLYEFVFTDLVIFVWFWFLSLSFSFSSEVFRSRERNFQWEFVFTDSVIFIFVLSFLIFSFFCLTCCDNGGCSSVLCSGYFIDYG